MHTPSTSVIAAQIQKDRAARLKRLELVAVTSGHLVNDLYAAFLTPLLPALVAKFDMSLALAGLLAAVYATTSSLVQPVVGHLADTSGSRAFIVLGPMVTAAAMCMIGLAGSPALLVALLIAGGVGSGMFHPQGAAMAGSIDHARKGFMLSAFTTAGEIGYALGPLVVLSVVSTLGMGHTYITVLPGVLVALFIYRFAPRTRPGHSAASGRGLRGGAGVSASMRAGAGVGASASASAGAGATGPRATVSANVGASTNGRSGGRSRRSAGNIGSRRNSGSSGNSGNSGTGNGNENGQAASEETRDGCSRDRRARGDGIRDDSTGAGRTDRVPVDALAMLWIVAAVRLCVTMGFTTFLPLYLKEMGLPLMAYGSVASLFMFAGTVGIMIAGPLADRIGAFRLMVVALLAPIPLFLGFLHTAGFLSYAFLAAAGVILYAPMPVITMTAQNLAPARAGTVSAFMMGVAWGAGSLGVAGVGVIADALGIRMALTVLLGALVIAATLAQALERRVSRQPAPAAPAKVL
ncbi:MAG: MFS transporter [Bacillota bacterium]